PRSAPASQPTQRISRSSSAKGSCGSSSARCCSATTTSPFATQSRSRRTDSRAVRYCIRNVKALRRAIKDVFGEHALVHRCHRHKERNVCDLLPERDRDRVRARMRAAWSLTDPELAEQRLELLAGELDRSWPDTAASLREGMAETLTLMRL